jgi:NAD(P)-dependent dehydrogenase (short-subunit alcohol dehydrogenase family)
MAEGLAGAGATVYLAARKADLLEQVAESIRSWGGAAEPVPTDLRDEEQIRALADRVGRLDILVNNAGIGTIGPAEVDPIKYFRYHLEVNLIAVMSLIRETVAPMLEAGRGRIINVASILGLRAAHWPQAGYTASKGGLVNLTRELAVQWAQKGITVNAIGPGYFHTDLTDELFETPEYKEVVERHTPMGRGGEPADIAGVCVFLASDAARYITGQIVCVDGGWTAW